MTFASPLAFLLLPIPWLAWRLLPAKRDDRAALLVPSSIISQLEVIRSQTQARARLILALLAWLSLTFAIAGPRLERTLDVVPASGRDIVLTLDLSGSMKTEDFDINGVRVSRLDAVKSVASEFVLSREGDRIGLVLFGDRAYYAAPLSFDTQSVASAIMGARIGVSGESTAISDGLGIAIKRLQKSSATSKVIILLSDGVDTSGTVDPAEAATLAQQDGITIHSIALGPKDTETDPNARDAVDARALAEIAENGGGEMFRVRSTSDLETVAEAINALEPSPMSRPPETYMQELWRYPAILAFWLGALLFAVEWRVRA